ncbi:ABC transporter substrate-binding protein [bacterium]|nr:ABC transporter substrate-binding protein [bacterium]
MRTISKIYMLSIVMSVFFLGCGRHIPSTAEQIHYGGVLNLQRLASLETLDPPEILFMTDLNTAALVYEGLLRIKDKYQCEPALASSMKVFDEGQRYRFFLRDSVYFHDDPCFPEGRGSSVRASDIVYCFNRLARLEAGAPLAYLFEHKIQGFFEYKNGDASSIKGIKIIDSLTVEFNLTKSFASFPLLLTTPAAFIYPAEAVEYYREEWPLHPVGTGAFNLSHWVALESLTFVRHHRYWGRGTHGGALPYLDGIKVLLTDDSALHQAAFLKGDLDILEIDADKLHALLKEMADSSSLTIRKMPIGPVRMLGFSLDKDTPVARNSSVRQCIARAFNRSRMVDAQHDSSRLAQALIPPDLFNINSGNWYDYDPHAALNDLHYLLPFPRRFDLKVMSNIEASGVLLAEEALRFLGFSARTVIQKGGYYQDIINKRPDLFRISFRPAYPDPEEYYSLFYSKAGPDVNLFCYENKTYDSLFDSALSELDPHRRNSIFSKMESILKNDVPALWLCHSSEPVLVIRSRLHDCKLRYNVIDYSRAWMDNDAFSGKFKD